MSGLSCNFLDVNFHTSGFRGQVSDVMYHVLSDTCFRCGSRTELLVGGTQLLILAFLSHLSPLSVNLLRAFLIFLPFITFSSVFAISSFFAYAFFSIKPIVFNIL